MKTLQPRATEKGTHIADLRDPGDDDGVGRDRESYPDTPSWVKVFGIIALVLVLLFVVLHLAGLGFGSH